MVRRWVWWGWCDGVEVGVVGMVRRWGWCDGAEVGVVGMVWRCVWWGWCGGGCGGDGVEVGVVGMVWRCVWWGWCAGGPVVRMSVVGWCGGGCNGEGMEVGVLVYQTVFPRERVWSGHKTRGIALPLGTGHEE